MERERLIYAAAALEYSRFALSDELEYKDACYLAGRACDELKQVAKWSPEEQARIIKTMELVGAAGRF
ncbi:MAG: hypothetical protein ACYTG3_19080 [Planctomycetota bacterium]|jgi:hypothetical protein